jgi:hypothetical protein
MYFWAEFQLPFVLFNPIRDPKVLAQIWITKSGGEKSGAIC